MRNKTAFRVALGGICSALGVFAMFCSGFLPMLDYTIPAAAGFMMVVMAVETNIKWAIGTYVSVSFLSIFITPNYEATILFIILLGYYPILKIGLDKLKNRVLAWGLKLLIFNFAAISFFMLFQYIFSNGNMLEGLERFGKYAAEVLLGIANAAFICYDIALKQVTDVYINWFRKSILRRKTVC